MTALKSCSPNISPPSRRSWTLRLAPARASLASVFLLTFVFTACGGGDALPPEIDGGGADIGGADTGVRDAAADEGVRDAGSPDGGDVDATMCADRDGDGHAAASCGGDDCDDALNSVNPDAADVCNGVDDDCDGVVDDGVPAGAACAAGLGACERPGTLSCVDGTYSTCSAVAGSPTTEACNGVDDDCDGTVDNDLPAGPSCTAGTGVCARTGTLSCDSGTYSLCSAVAAEPGTETCNDLDDDCDGTVDNDVPSGAACTVGVSACQRSGTLLCVGGTYSSCSAVAGLPATETCNGVDDDCDGLTDDGVPPGGACAAGIGACLRTGILSCVGGTYSSCNAVAGSPTTETCNGLDDDCDGVVDDGAAAGGACTVGTGACTRSGSLSCAGGTYSLCDALAGAPTTELCNGLDDDCDGVVDDAVPVGASCSAGTGTCVRSGSLLCAGGTYSSCSAVAGLPTAETCNGLDDDCDGATDDGVPLGGSCTGGTGACMRSGTLSCASGTYSSCSAIPGSPITETCNGLDDDCDGAVDDGVPLGGSCAAGVGACVRSGTLSCASGTYSSCNAVAGSPGIETCNGVDDDCDGVVDDGVPPGGACTVGVGACVRSGTLSCAGGTYSSCSAVAAFPGTETCNGVDDDCDGAVDDGVCITELSSGYLHTCARRSSGAVVCWGSNIYGQLGDATTTNRLTPRPVSGLSDAVEISASEFHSCARRSSGVVVCWGSNIYGQLGDATTTDRPTPVLVSGLTDAVELSTGRTHTCARRSSGTVVCWGDNSGGQLGDGTTTLQRLIPTPVSGLIDAVELSAGNDHTCARRSSGAVVCWGYGWNGQLGDGTNTSRNTPTPVTGLTDAVEISAGINHSCARRSSGAVACWGDNGQGRLGDGTTTSRNTPSPVFGLSDAVEISAGGEFTCARRSSGAALCWGYNGNGQLGDGTTTERWTPTPVSGLTDAVEISAGGKHTCARRISGSARCWGRNGSGELGDGSTTDRWTPTAVLGI